MGHAHVLLVDTSGSLYRCMPDHTRGAGVPVLLSSVLSRKLVQVLLLPYFKTFAHLLCKFSIWGLYKCPILLRFVECFNNWCGQDVSSFLPFSLHALSPSLCYCLFFLFFIPLYFPISLPPVPPFSCLIYLYFPLSFSH